MTKLQPIEMVVFDMAGTTVEDSGDVVADCLKQAVSAMETEVSAESIKSLMGKSKIELIRALLARKAEPIHDDFVDRMVSYYSNHAWPVINAEYVFDELRKLGVKVCLNTGFPGAVAETILSKLKWKESYIDGYMHSDETFRRPFPDMIDSLRGDILPSRVCKVGDTLVDLQEGRNAKCGLVVGVTYGSCGVSIKDHLLEGEIAIDTLPELLGMVKYSRRGLKKKS